MQKPNVEKSFSIGSVTDAEVGTVHTYGANFKLKFGKSEAVGVGFDASEPSAKVLNKEASLHDEDVKLSHLY